VIDFDAKDTRSALGALRHNPHISSDASRTATEGGSSSTPGFININYHGHAARREDRR
jgi:hypothetical protein